MSESSPVITTFIRTDGEGISPIITRGTSKPATPLSSSNRVVMAGGPPGTGGSDRSQSPFQGTLADDDAFVDDKYRAMLDAKQREITQLKKLNDKFFQQIESIQNEKSRIEMELRELKMRDGNDPNPGMDGASDMNGFMILDDGPSTSSLEINEYDENLSGNESSQFPSTGNLSSSRLTGQPSRHRHKPSDHVLQVIANEERRFENELMTISQHAKEMEERVETLKGDLLLANNAKHEKQKELQDKEREIIVLKREMSEHKEKYDRLASERSARSVLSMTPRSIISLNDKEDPRETPKNDDDNESTYVQVDSIVRTVIGDKEIIVVNDDYQEALIAEIDHLKSQLISSQMEVNALKTELSMIDIPSKPNDYLKISHQITESPYSIPAVMPVTGTGPESWGIPGDIPINSDEDIAPAVLFNPVHEEEKLFEPVKRQESFKKEREPTSDLDAMIAKMDQDDKGWDTCEEEDDDENSKDIGNDPGYKADSNRRGRVRFWPKKNPFRKPSKENVRKTDLDDDSIPKSDDDSRISDEEDQKSPVPLEKRSKSSSSSKRDKKHHHRSSRKHKKYHRKKHRKSRKSYKRLPSSSGSSSSSKRSKKNSKKSLITPPSSDPSQRLLRGMDRHKPPSSYQCTTCSGPAWANLF